MKRKKKESDQHDEIGTPVPILASEIGTRIEQVADTFKSRKDAAEAAGVSTDQLGRWFRGENLRTLLSIASMCYEAKFDLQWLATGDKTPSSLGITEEGGEYTEQHRVSETVLLCAYLAEKLLSITPESREALLTLIDERADEYMDENGQQPTGRSVTFTRSPKSHGKKDKKSA